MPDDASILEAMEAHPAIAEEALAIVQTGTDAPVTMPVILVMAQELGVEALPHALHVIGQRGWRDAFVQALQARGVLLEAFEDPDDALLRFDEGGRFLSRAAAFRCRIEAGPDAESSGSGCLIGPRLVVTAAHVVSRSPDDGSAVMERIRVRLADGRVLDTVGAPVFISACSPGEYGPLFPKADGDFGEHDDIAILRLETAEGARVGYARLPETCEPYRPRPLLLLHYPEGVDNRGMSMGRTSKIRNISARVGHDAAGAAGSSGGACFSARFEILGIHQGRWDTQRRFVPLARVIDRIRPIVASDVSPTSLWSLDDTADGLLVIGRDRLFEAVDELLKPTTMARGIRLYRTAQEGEDDGLDASYRIIRRLLQLRTDDIRLLRIGSDPLKRDLLQTLAQEAATAGLAVAIPPDHPGVRDGDTTPEATIRDRAARLAADLQAAAGDRPLWIHVQDDADGLTLSEQIQLEAFTEAVLVQPSLRIIVAGFEAMGTAGETFDSQGQALGAVAPGLLRDVIRSPGPQEVRIFIRRVREALGQAVDPDEARTIADTLTGGFPAPGGAFESDILIEVRRRLRDWVAGLIPVQLEAVA